MSYLTRAGVEEMRTPDRLSNVLCPNCEENFVEEYNLEVPGICDNCQNNWVPNDYEGDL